MARIPGPEALGRRGEVSPALGVATYNPVDPSTPSLRTPVGDLGAPDRARVDEGNAEIALGQSLETTGLRELARSEAAARALEVAAQHEQDRQDTLRAEDAFNKLRNTQLDMTTGEDGYARCKGAQARQPADPQELHAALRRSRQAALRRPGQRRAAQLFARRAAVTGLQFKEGILHHTIAEGNTYATEVFEGVVNTETRAACPTGRTRPTSTAR
jgi:hypothetical protein